MPNLIPTIELRRRKVFELMRAGYLEQEVADITGSTLALVRSDIRTVLANTQPLHQDNIDQTRALELARLDRLSTAAYPYCLPRKQVIEGKEIDVPPDPQMGYYFLAVMDRRAKYLGLHAPQQRVTISVPWERLSVEQIARAAGGEDLRVIMAEVEATEAAGDSGKGEEKNITPDPRKIPVQVMVDSSHPLARLSEDELAELDDEIEELGEPETATKAKGKAKKAPLARVKAKSSAKAKTKTKVKVKVRAKVSSKR